MKDKKIRPQLKKSREKMRKVKAPIFIDSDLSSIQELETLINPVNRKSEMTHNKKYKSKEFMIEPIKLRSPTVKTFKEADIDFD